MRYCSRRLDPLAHSCSSDSECARPRAGAIKWRGQHGGGGSLGAMRGLVRNERSVCGGRAPLGLVERANSARVVIETMRASLLPMVPQ